MENQDRQLEDKPLEKDQFNTQIKQEILMDSNEDVKVVLGDSYLKNYLKRGRLEKSFAILTDKRVYMRGKCYEKKGLFGLRKTTVDKILDVQDITGTEYRKRNQIWKTVLKWLMLVFIAVCFIIDLNSFVSGILNDRFTIGQKLLEVVWTIMRIGFHLSLLWLVLKIRTHYEFLTITFSGGQLAYDCNVATTTEVNSFQREMRLAKDRQREMVQAPVQNRIVVNDLNSQRSESSFTGDKLKNLKDIKDLLDAGVITQAEFNTLKAEIMGQFESLQRENQGVLF